MKRKETDVGTVVTAYFQERGFETYQEVTLSLGDRRADLVADCPKLLVIVECKTSLSLDVIAQARAWRDIAHLSYVAVPRIAKSYGRGGDARRTAHDVCRHFGVGVIQVDSGSYCEEVVRPALNRRAMPELMRRVLHDGHKTSVAGQAGGGHWTPFRETCDGVRAFVGKNPGCTLRELIAGIQHHYKRDSTAGSCLSGWIRAKKVSGVEVRDDGRLQRFYLNAAQPSPPRPAPEEAPEK